jgi:thiamine monophosphate synthase
MLHMHHLPLLVEEMVDLAAVENMHPVQVAQEDQETHLLRLQL